MSCEWQWLQMSGCPLQLGARNNDSARNDCSGLRYAQHEANFLRDIVTPVMSRRN
jgi:hypothetical protein